MGFLAICMSSSEKCLFKFFCSFLNQVAYFLLLSFRSSLYILDTDPLSDIRCGRKIKMESVLLREPL